MLAMKGLKLKHKWNDHLHLIIEFTPPAYESWPNFKFQQIQCAHKLLTKKYKHGKIKSL